MRLGNNSGIGDFCYIQGPVQIGENVMMAPYVALIAANHNVSRTDVPMNQQGAYEEQITIEDDVSFYLSLDWGFVPSGKKCGVYNLSEFVYAVYS